MKCVLLFLDTSVDISIINNLSRKEGESMAKGSDFMNNILKNRQKASGRKATGTDKIKDAVMNGGEKTKKSNGIMNTMKNMSKTFKNVANKVKNIASGITKLVNILISLFSSPVTWVIIALIFIYLLVQSGTNILGQSDYALNCSIGADMTAGTIQGTGGDLDKKGSKVYNLTKEVYVTARQLGLNPYEAAGLAANGYVEGGSTGELDRHEIGGGGGRGIFQFTSKTLNDYENFAASKHKAPFSSAQLETEGIISIKKGTGTIKQFKANSIESGVRAAYLAYENNVPALWLPNSDNVVHAPRRIAAAKTIYKNFKDLQVKGATNGDYTTMNADGDSSSCQQTGDTSSITSFAKSLVITNNISSANVSKDGNGWEQATDAYRQAYQKVGGPMSGTVGKLLASCDSFVATVMRNTVDKNFPWHATTQQQEYVKKNKHYKKIKCGDQQPGDFAFGEDSPGGPVQHIFIIANKQATEAYAASYHDHVAIDDKTSDYGSGGRKLGGCSGVYLHGADGHDYGEIWRYVG